MSKEMIISVNGREKKIAILDNGRVTEFYIERGEENSGIAGNIYKGRVQRVLPGMQSAFVAIGLERDAFLYVSDFFDEEEEIERIVMEKSKKTPEEAKREANDKIDRARIDREKQMEAVQELAEPLVETAEGSDEPEEEVAKPKRGRGRRGGRTSRTMNKLRNGKQKHLRSGNRFRSLNSKIPASNVLSTTRTRARCSRTPICRSVSSIRCELSSSTWRAHPKRPSDR